MGWMTEESGLNLW